MQAERYVTSEDTRSRYGLAAVSTLEPLKPGDTLDILLGRERLFLSVHAVQPKEGTQAYPTVDLAGPRRPSHITCTGFLEVPPSWNPKPKLDKCFAPSQRFPKRWKKTPKLGFGG